VPKTDLDFATCAFQRLRGSIEKSAKGKSMVWFVVPLGLVMCAAIFLAFRKVARQGSAPAQVTDESGET
jgi:hypothetical protein